MEYLKCLCKIINQKYIITAVLQVLICNSALEMASVKEKQSEKQHIILYVWAYHPYHLLSTNNTKTVKINRSLH